MMIGHMRSMGIKVFRTPYRSALSTCALILLNCYLICEFPRLSLGGNKHAAEHHLCPLRQGATDLCHIRRYLSGNRLLNIVHKCFIMREFEDRFASQPRTPRSSITM